MRNLSEVSISQAFSRDKDALRMFGELVWEACKANYTGYDFVKSALQEMSAKMQVPGGGSQETFEDAQAFKKWYGFAQVRHLV